MLKKVKDIALGTRMAGGVINRRQLVSIATGVVRANNPNLLKEYGGNLVFTDKWARGVLEKLTWSKRKGTTGKVAEEKFTFQRNISALVSEHDIPPSLIINIDQIPLSYVNTGKYTFTFTGAKNIPIKRVDDTRQITATLAVSCTGEFLSIQLIYTGKTERSLSKYSFPPSFSVTFTENHWSNTEKSVEFFKELIFPYLEDTKRNKSYPLEHHALIIMDFFKWQDNDTLKKLCAENDCDVVIVPHNLTIKFQPLDLSVNKAAKSFIQSKHNDWFDDQVFTQLQNGKYPTDVKISSKLSDLKPTHARWIVDWYHHVIKEKEVIVRGFNSAGISEAVQNVEDIYEKSETPFRE